MTNTQQRVLPTDLPVEQIRRDDRAPGSVLGC
jgi:hypothetical protein